MSDDAVRSWFPAGWLGRRGASPAGVPRGRLFRKYVLLFVGLVSVVLLINGGLDFWFAFEENKAALFRIQQEKAGSAASASSEFVDEIERQIGWTTHAQWVRRAAGPAQIRLCAAVAPGAGDHRADPSSTATARSSSKVSRLAMDVVGSGADYSQEPSLHRGAGAQACGSARSISARNPSPT